MWAREAEEEEEEEEEMGNLEKKKGGSRYIDVLCTLYDVLVQGPMYDVPRTMYYVLVRVLCTRTMLYSLVEDYTADRKRVVPLAGLFSLQPHARTAPTAHSAQHMAHRTLHPLH